MTPPKKPVQSQRQDEADGSFNVKTEVEQVADDAACARLLKAIEWAQENERQRLAKEQAEKEQRHDDAA